MNELIFDLIYQSCDLSVALFQSSDFTSFSFLLSHFLPMNIKIGCNSSLFLFNSTMFVCFFQFLSLSVNTHYICISILIFLPWILIYSVVSVLSFAISFFLSISLYFSLFLFITSVYLYMLLLLLLEIKPHRSFYRSLFING